MTTKSSEGKGIKVDNIYCSIKVDDKKKFKAKQLDWEKEFLKYCSDFIIKLNYTDERYLLSFISSLLQQQKEQIYKDLIKVADNGEYEDLRRELNIYFKGKDE